jgi:21S rRNA (uridine2791-2'-O)-methyltransferase
MFTLLPTAWRHVPRPGSLSQARQASSKRWQARQQKDQFTREAAVQGLKSRAAFKLLQVNNNHLIIYSPNAYPDTQTPCLD